MSSLQSAVKHATLPRLARLVSGLALTSILLACVTYPTVGSAPSETPPRVVTDPADPQKRVWNNPSAFGPVPANLAAKGQATCDAFNTQDTKYKAIGYHPKAQNANGQTMAEGGYYCVPK